MGYKALRSVARDHDLSLIFDHFFETYQNLGDAPDETFERASAVMSSSGAATDVQYQDVTVLVGIGICLFPSLTIPSLHHWMVGISRVPPE